MQEEGDEGEDDPDGVDLEIEFQQPGFNEDDEDEMFNEDEEAESESSDESEEQNPE